MAKTPAKMTRTLLASARCPPRRPTGGGRASAVFWAAALAGLVVAARGPAHAKRRSPAQPATQPRAARAQLLPEPTRWTATHGERELRFRLTDEGGTPVTGAELQLDAAPGVTVTLPRAGAAGEYSTSLRWPVAIGDLGLTVQLPGRPRASELALVLPPAELEPPPAPLAEPPEPPEPPPDEEPEPAPLLPVPPPERAPPAPLAPPARAPARRVSFELGLAGTALVNQGVYGFGGGAEVGARFRLPFGGLGVSLRVALEQHLQPEPAPFLINLGVALTYTLSRPRWRVSPYLGLWTQALLQRTPDALGAIALQRNEGGLALGGLAGAQVRLWRGGLFTELGYRGTVYRQTVAVVPAWSTVFLLLGYRLTTN